MALTGCLLLAGIGAAKAAELSDIAWLAGDWVQVGESRTVREVWVGPTEDMLAGMAVTYGPGRKTVVERMRIAKTDGVLGFTAELDGQPPTTFPLKSLHGELAVFENLAHDFPQRVIYRRTPDGLAARIEGEVEGAAQGMDWRYVPAP